MKAAVPLLLFLTVMEAGCAAFSAPQRAPQPSGEPLRFSVPSSGATTAPRTTKPPSNEGAPVPRPEPSSPVLSPEIRDGDRERVRQEVGDQLRRVARVIDGMDPNTLAVDQKDMYASLLDCVSKAHAALDHEDLAGAQILAEKASRLARSLAGSH